MKYTSTEDLLATPAEEYFDEHIQNALLKKKILRWLCYASDEIFHTSRPCHSDYVKNRRVLISDIIFIPEKTIRRYRCMGKLTVKAMNSALGINGLSLDMHLNQIAALFKNVNQDADIDTLEKVAELTKNLIQEKEEGKLSVNLGKEILPGYECTLNFRKI